MSQLYKVKIYGKEELELPTLHPDDTIDIVKRKIIIGIDSDISYDSIYMYIVKNESFVPEQLYKQLTQNGKLDLTYERLRFFLLNFHDKMLLEKLERKDNYSIGDLYNLRLNKSHLMDVAIGLRFIGSKRENYPFTVNPNKIQAEEDVDKFMLENASSLVTTQNGNLLMDYGEIHNNIIYVIPAERVFSHFKDLNIEPLSGVYFPFLQKKDIGSLSSFNKERETLLDQNKALLNKNVERKFKSVNLMYDLYRRKQYPLLESGIKKIEFFLHQSLKMIIPLEQLFKILHSTRQIPFIKYNPGFRRENLLRLYSNEQTFNGTKIPFLSKASIIKLIKTIGKSKTISLSLENNIVCSIFENGSINIEYESEELHTIEDIEERIRVLINPILEIIKKYVDKSGFSYDLFSTFKSNSIEIVSMDYKSKMKIDSKFILKQYMSCVSAVFNVTQDQIGKGIQARYKRVANYNEMSAIDAFIRDTINQGNQRENIIEKIKDNFDITREQAEEKFIKFINEVEVEQGLNQNRKLRIKDNPGFATTFEMEKFTTNLIVSITGINSTLYLDIIPIYLSSIVEMTQGTESELVKSVCSAKPIVEEKAVEEITAVPENPFGENETPVITQAEELKFDDDGDDDLLDMLMGSDDEEEEEEDSGMSGGVGPKSIQDITGMSLSNPNYFSKRMEERDPSLFLKKKTGKFNAYSRMCPSNIRRQPVILTEEEKERIDKTHPNSYTHSIKYGSDPENPYYYICPRYWCIPENTSLSEEEVKAGACGGVDAIIPYDAKKIPKGKTIYEFGADPSDKSAHSYKEYYDEEGNYVPHYPGFIPGSKHPDGKCMPCCFKSWDAKEQVRRRQECAQDLQGKKAKVIKKRKPQESQKDYIKGEEKFPLEPQRWGYLPIQLQLFFDEDAKNVQVSALDPVLKDNAVTLLRQGVETHPTQSFIACIADIYNDYSNEEIKKRVDKELKQLRKQLKAVRKGDSSNKEEKAQEITRQIQKIQKKPTIKEMKSIIINMLTIDNFSNYQNGNLVTEFYHPSSREVSIDDYQDSLLYKALDTTDEAQLYYFEKLINSFENFIDYLKDDSAVLDYQYLWDIVCLPDENLFPNGINLVIFEIPDDDITGNVELICPTNHYSNVMFSDKRLTFMIVKKENFFEPIYLFDNMKKDVSRFMFREQNLLGKPNIKLALSSVREYLTTKCKPLDSLPRVYTFETNYTLDKILTLIDKYINSVISIVINYNGKAIGVYIEMKNKSRGFVPCFPSNFKVTPEVSILFVDDDRYLDNYDNTVTFLTNISKMAKLPCSPHCKVIEDSMIVGILTKTNQLIPIKVPEENKNDDLDTCNVNFNERVNKAMITDTSIDNKRETFLKALESEKEFYNSFRNLARIELNRYKNQDTKNKIIKTIDDEDKNSLDNYTQVLLQISTELKKLLGDKVVFTEDNYDSDNYVFPLKNLVTGKNNEAFYFLRLADEALRYQRIKLFLFEKEKYLSFENILYQLNDDEILILESMINNDYFDGLVAYKRNKYVHFNTYDTAQPLVSVPYNEKITVEKCNVKTKPLTGAFLQQIFTDGYYVKEFGESKKENRTPMCSFELIITILKNEGKNVSRREIQQLLAENYEKYSLDKVLAILSSEGKEQWIKLIYGEKITLEEFILSEHYYLTILDIWMISTLFKIPIMLFGQYTIKINDKRVFATMAKSKEYYVIRTFAPKMNTIPKYSLIETKHKIIKIPVSELLSKKEFFTAFTEKTKTGKFVLPKNPIEIKIGDYIENYNV